MIPDTPVLLLLLAAGACLAAGIPGLLNPAWAAQHYWQLALVGASLPLLALVPVAVADERAERRSQRQARDAATAERLARLDASLSHQEGQGESILPEPTPDALERKRAQQEAHWRVYYRRLWQAGAAYGWDIRTLTDKGRPTRVTTQPGWNTATDRLAEAHAIAKDQTGTRPLVSDAYWNETRMWEMVACPEGEPPEILPPPYTRQQTPQQTTAKQPLEA